MELRYSLAVHMYFGDNALPAVQLVHTLGEGGSCSRQRTRDADRSGSCRRLVGMMARRVVGSGCHAASTFFAYARGMWARASRKAG